MCGRTSSARAPEADHPQRRCGLSRPIRPPSCQGIGAEAASDRRQMTHLTPSTREGLERIGTLIDWLVVTVIAVLIVNAGTLMWLADRRRR